ncbi:hypothetical protein FANTH_2110 [Fusarium anthophilum]|uniref:MFS general substrate transporter n=1 Tax=Fusarium anthophilum TaxID=48485 RepID=A0A8H5EAL0_9HYPO|nr:hypothetical protein FANTH_2110 [Fusarium anthophilum]
MIANGIGTSAYQAIIQLTVDTRPIFDMFFVHERGRMLSVYVFSQRLGSILGLSSGGSMSDTVGWRWSQNIVGFIFSFEETLFSRFLFAGLQSTPLSSQKDEETAEKSTGGKKLDLRAVSSQANGIVDDFPKRSYRQILKPWVKYPQNKTSFWQYFLRPFFLWGLPNVVIAAFIYAFGATAGIVSFNTISEILTEPPYNFSTTHTGLVFFAALIGDIIGWGIGVISDQVVIALARHNGGDKEPEMRLYMLVPCFVLAAVGYMLYGWGAQTEAHWITIAIGIGAMISHQVEACTIATAYAMGCFPGISGELVVVLAMCSSMVNFAISYSVQPFIEAAGYGWTMTCFGIMVLLSVFTAIFLVRFGKKWRIAKGPRYYQFLDEVGG